jgi:hypothetical protein
MVVICDMFVVTTSLGVGNVEKLSNLGGDGAGGGWLGYGFDEVMGTGCHQFPLAKMQLVMVVLLCAYGGHPVDVAYWVRVRFEQQGTGTINVWDNSRDISNSSSIEL